MIFKSENGVDYLLNLFTHNMTVII